MVHFEFKQPKQELQQFDDGGDGLLCFVELDVGADGVRDDAVDGFDELIFSLHDLSGFFCLLHFLAHLDGFFEVGLQMGDEHGVEAIGAEQVMNFFVFLHSFLSDFLLNVHDLEFFVYLLSDDELFRQGNDSIDQNVDVVVVNL